MEWIKLNDNNIPVGSSVLAANFNEGDFLNKKKIYGYIYKDSYDDFVCENEYQILYNVTHFIDIDKFDL